MKKSTWILMLVAIAVVAGVYFYETKRGGAHETTAETTKPAFQLKQDDITGLTLAQSGQTIAVEKHDGEWVITQPVHTRADQAAINAVASGIAMAHISRTLSAKPDQLKSYGLDAPAVTLEIKSKGGEQHRVRLGAEEFSGLLVYAMLDQSHDIVLLPQTLLHSANKPLSELRDLSVLNVSQWDVAGFDLRNHSGEVRASKRGSDWVIERPRETAADSTEVSSLLSQISSAKMTEVDSETGENLSKYGLEKPGLSFRVRLLKGEERALLIGKKVDDQYYARDTSRSMVFRVKSDLTKRLDTPFFQLRDKSIVHFKQDELTRIRIRNQYVNLVCEKNAQGLWVVKEPAEKKDKEVQTWKLFNPLETTRAKEIIDSPPASVAARLAHPAVEVELTDKSGKTTKLALSAASGDDVYARTSAGPAIYKAGKQFLDGLNFKLADVAL